MLDSDPVTHPLIDPAGHHHFEQCPRVYVLETAQRQLGQAGELVPGARLADREQEHNRLGEKTAGDEFEHLR